MLPDMCRVCPTSSPTNIRRDDRYICLPFGAMRSRPCGLPLEKITSLRRLPLSKRRSRATLPREAIGSSVPFATWNCQPIDSPSAGSTTPVFSGIRAPGDVPPVVCNQTVNQQGIATGRLGVPRSLERPNELKPCVGTRPAAALIRLAEDCYEAVRVAGALNGLQCALLRVPRPVLRPGNAEGSW